MSDKAEKTATLEKERDELEQLKKDIDAGKLRAREEQDYLDKWVEQVMPFRTLCYRCRRDSPVVYIINPGTPLDIRFGGPGDPRRTDIANPLIEAFGRVGWSFEPRRSYCPTCKGQGT